MLINVPPGRWTAPASSRGGSDRPSPPRLSATDTRPCPFCGADQGTTAYPIPPQLRATAGADVRYFWTACPCEEARRGASEALLAASSSQYQQRLAGAVMDRDGLREYNHLQLRSFNPGRLRPVDGVHPYHDVVLPWLTAVEQLERGREHTGPPLALWFYSPQPGRGKTHLAAGCAHDLKAEGHLVSFIDGRLYPELIWATPMEHRPTLRALPGRQARLTIIDDLGRVGGGQGASDEWDKLISLRYERRGWLIVTSQKTPDQLLAEGRIVNSTHSRLMGMTRETLITFDGEDMRRAQEDADATYD